MYWVEQTSNHGHKKLSEETGYSDAYYNDMA